MNSKKHDILIYKNINSLTSDIILDKQHEHQHAGSNEGYTGHIQNCCLLISLCLLVLKMEAIGLRGTLVAKEELPPEKGDVYDAQAINA